MKARLLATTLGTVTAWLGLGGVMENFIDAFRRNADGSWSCIRDVTLNGPGGRIQVVAGSTFQRGASFMGVDLAGFLDAHARAERPRQVNH